MAVSLGEFLMRPWEWKSWVCIYPCIHVEEGEFCHLLVAESCPFGVTAWFWFFSGDTKEVDNKKEKECDIIDLTLDSDSESEKDTNDNDDDQESDNDRDLNTPRYIVCFSAPHVGCIHFCQ